MFLASNSQAARPEGGQPRLLRPMLGLADRIRTTTRLTVLAAVLLVPGVVGSYAYSGVIGDDIQFASSEQAGVEALLPALQAMAASTGGTAVDLRSLRQAVARHPDLHLEKEMVAVEGAAKTLGTPAERLAAVTALGALVTAIGNNSNLILDPDLDAFYLMDAQVVQIPKALQTAAQAQVLAPDITTSSLIATQAVQAGTLDSAASSLVTDVDTVKKETALAGLDQRITPVRQFAEATADLSKDMVAALGVASAPDPAALSRAAAAAVPPAASGLTDLLQARIDKLAGERNTVLLITALSVLLAVWFAAAVWWRTRRDVGLTVTAVQAISDGDLQPFPLPGGQDELGDIGRALRVARDRLVAQGEQLEDAHLERERQMHSAFIQQRSSEKQNRERVRAIVSETSQRVQSELASVLGQVEGVRGAADTIDERLVSTDAATREVIAKADHANEVASALGASLRQVASMASLISGVADQTKLLALNATIEAARAGTAGRGFSVVADEVKELAATTDRSTSEIRAIIATLESDAEAVGSVITSMSAGVGDVDEASGALRHIASDQRGLVEELTQSVKQALDQVASMSSLADEMERRVHERVPTNVASTAYQGERALSVELSNISLGGLRCLLEPGAAMFRDLPVEVDVPMEHGVVRIRSTIVSEHADPRTGRVALGLEFLAVSPQVKELLEFHIQEKISDS
jgi:methyl-accepting chemotaxis protein